MGNNPRYYSVDWLLKLEHFKPILLLFTFKVEGKGFENDNFPRKTNAKVVNNSDCKTSNNVVTTGNICVAGDSSGSLCVVSWIDD